MQKLVELRSWICTVFRRWYKLDIYIYRIIYFMYYIFICIYYRKIINICYRTQLVFL